MSTSNNVNGENKSNDKPIDKPIDKKVGIQC